MQFDGTLKWSMGNGNLMLAVPKKRGKGFLRQPVGHHVTDFTKFLNTLPNVKDFWGLDGYLNLELTYEDSRDKEVCFKLAAKVATYHNVKVDYNQVPFDEFLTYIANQYETK